MVLFYPEVTGISYPAWVGELSLSNLKALKNSPSRQTIASRLLQGETAVFLFLESGKPETDRPYYDRLQSEVLKLSGTLKIPDNNEAFGQAQKFSRTMPRAG
jgi:hypothetical protein